MISTQNYVRFLKAEAKRNLILAFHHRVLGNEIRWERHMRYARNSIRMAQVLA
jgi:hypothetical protein